MQDLPHHYTVTVKGEPETNLISRSGNLPKLEVAPPLQFGGTGTNWSPEELLMAAVSNCFILSFKVISQASKLDWLSIECESTGTLDKVERKIKFTGVKTKATLKIANEANREKALKILNKSEEACLISNSLNCESHLECEIIIVGE